MWRIRSIPTVTNQDSRGLSNNAHTELPIMFFVLRLKCLFAGSPAAFGIGNCIDCLPWGLVCPARASSPLNACRRFTLSNLVASLVVTFWCDPESTGRLGVKLACGWQILSLLKSANARPGPEPEDAIDVASVVSFVTQSLLHLLDIASMPDSWHFVAEIGSRSDRCGAWSGDPCRQR